MESYESIVRCVLNHYQNESAIKFPALIRFIKSTGNQVMERNLTEAEFDRVFDLVFAALFSYQSKGD